MDIAGKVAVVTGAGAGIGAAIARSLARGGARVAVADLNGDAARGVAAEIAAEVPDSAFAFEGDVSDAQVITELVDRAEAEFGPVDLYFANAGVTGGLGLESTEEQWSTALG